MNTGSASTASFLLVIGGCATNLLGQICFQHCLVATVFIEITSYTQNGANNIWPTSGSDPVVENRRLGFVVGDNLAKQIQLNSCCHLAHTKTVLSNSEAQMFGPEIRFFSWWGRKIIVTNTAISCQSVEKLVRRQSETPIGFFYFWRFFLSQSRDFDV